MLAGTLTFTGCVWLENTLFGVETGAGLVRPHEKRLVEYETSGERV